MKPLAAALILLAFQQTADLTWKPVAGTEHKYRLVMTSAMDIGQGPTELLVRILSTEKVTEVTDDAVTVESIPGETVVTVNGQEMDTGVTRQPSYSTKRSRDGMAILEPQSTAPMARTNRGIMATSFPRPAKPLALGEPYRWTVKADAEKETRDGEGKVTLKGEETVRSIACWKLEYVYSETGKDSPMSAVGTLWLDKSDGKLVKSDMALENFRSVNLVQPAAAHVILELVTGS